MNNIRQNSSSSNMQAKRKSSKLRYASVKRSSEQKLMQIN